MKQGIKPVKNFRCGRWWLALVLPWLLLSPGGAWAQRGRHRPARPDTTSRTKAARPAVLGDTARVQLELQPDSLVAVPRVGIDSARLEWLRTAPTLRDLVGDRVGCLETDVPHQFNNSVMAYVTLFTARNRSYLQRVLEREQLYFPLFETYLARYGLPIDLKYLAVVESALIPTAKSPVGATGLWQFMGPTAGDLRLRRDEWVDERMAPEKATEAACKHLRYLYGVFHDWELVLAAYNWGAGSVQRVMRRTGQKNFWDLYPYMPAETRNYVPTFTAIMYSMKYAEAHGLRTAALRYQVAEPLDTLGLRGQAFDLRRLSRACGFDDSLYLARFNPELRRAALPAGYRPYVVRYPAAARAALGGADRATILDYCRPAAALPTPLAGLPPRLDGVAPWPAEPLLAATAGPRAPAEAAAPRARRVAHRVRRGETVAGLAERFDVSPAQLRGWNELPKNRPLKPGRELVVFVPVAAPRPEAAPAPSATPETVAVLRPVQPALPDAEALARREQATANAREVARVQELIRQEKLQEVRLVAMRQRQALQQAVAAAQARAAAHPIQHPEAEVRPIPTTAPSAVRESIAEAAPGPAADAVPYMVRPGDYLTKLAREHRLSVAQLVAWNGLASETVVPGQRLVFHAPVGEEPALATARSAGTDRPAPPQVHLVQPGDTLFNLSRRFGVSVQRLREANHLASDDVRLGQKLLVPQG